MNNSDPKSRGGKSFIIAWFGKVLSPYRHHVGGDGAVIAAK